MNKCSCGYVGFAVEFEDHITYMHSIGEYQHQEVEQHT